MHKTFNEYYEIKEVSDFNDKFKVLCENIVNFGVNVEDYWLNYALPVILEGDYDNEEELLEFFGKWFGGGEKIPRPSGETPEFKRGKYDIVNDVVQTIKNSLIKHLQGILSRMESRKDSPRVKMYWQVVKSFINTIEKKQYKPKFIKGSQVGKDYRQTRQRRTPVVARGDFTPFKADVGAKFSPSDIHASDVIRREMHK